MKLLTLTFIVFFSCNSTNLIVQGEYYTNGKDFKKTLVLEKDGTFILSQSTFEITSKCKGKWTYISQDTIILKCSTENFPAQISNGYMKERDTKIVILSSKKIQLNGIVLKFKN